MQWRKVVLAAILGGVTYPALKVALDRLSILALGYPYNTHVPLPNVLQVFILAPAVVSIIGAVPVGVLSGWRRGLVAAFIGYLSGAGTYRMTRFFTTLLGGSIFQTNQREAMAFIVGAGVTALVASIGRKESRPFGPFVIVALVGMLITSIIVAGGLALDFDRRVAALACALLPAVAALLQRRPDEVDEGFESGTYTIGAGEAPTYASERRPSG